MSATEYATGVCGAVGGWVDDIQTLNADLQASLDPNDIDALKDVMVDFLDDVVTATDSAISDVEAVGVPDVEDGETAAETVLTALRDSKAVFEDARDRVEGLSTADPAAFGEELQTLGTDLQTSMSGIGGSSISSHLPSWTRPRTTSPSATRWRPPEGAARGDPRARLVYW